MNCCFAQQDTILSQSSFPQRKSFAQHALKKELIVPTTLITFGIISVNNPYMRRQNQWIRDGIQKNRNDRFPIDDYTQFASQAAFLGLDLVGVKPKHNLKERLFTGAVSHAIMAVTVNLMKGCIPVVRPDFSASNSFPSGHTATAFVGAELLWQEYHHKSIWYGVAGYTVAAGTGFFRMYNDRHWLTDIAMGAGIGIASSKIAYWILPILEHKKIGISDNFIVLPAYNGEYVGFSMLMQL